MRDKSLRKPGIGKFWRRCGKTSAKAIIPLTFIFISLSLADNEYKGAIIISGSNESAFSHDVSKFKTALTDTSVGYGVPINSIYSGTNQTFNQFRDAISQMNNNAITELYIYLSTHGTLSGGIKFSNGMVSINTFVSAVTQSSSTTIHVVLDYCFSGLIYYRLSNALGPNCTVITAADETHEAKFGNGGSLFTSILARLMTDPGCDSNHDGKVTDLEALSMLRIVGGDVGFGYPKSASIPTLSEWKQIFLTLLMLCLVMGFEHSRSPKLCMGNVGIMHCARISRLIVLDRQLFPTVMQWVSAAVVLGLAGATLLFGSVSMLDIVGTLFCAPLVAYIVHLVVLAVGEYSGDQR